MRNYALIVDDDRSERRLVSGVMRAQLDMSPIEAENGVQALDVLTKSENIKIIILDLDMPIMDGREGLRRIKALYPHIPVIVLTGSKKTDDAVNAIKDGAADFLTKPLKPERLTVSAHNALKMSLMAGEITRLKRKTDGLMQFTDLIGHDQGLARSIAIGKKTAASHLPVLVTGQTGTGKEMFARAIHGASDRAGHEFIAVNCGAIPEKLVESTLFGHEKGAFTGAIDKALGKFQEANGGTIFLDEVGELPLDAQVKLLRALQQKEIEPVGSGKAIHVDVRVISATNRDLAEEVKAGRFREDLYFRLNVLGIELPPLQLRGEDIEELAQYFIQSYAASHNAALKTLSSAAIDLLKQHNWPGNVRELENAIHRAMALSDGHEITDDDLRLMGMPAASDYGSGQAPHGAAGTLTKSATNSTSHTITLIDDDGEFRSFKNLEADIMQRALNHHHNNMSQTARVLGIAKSTLYAKLESASDKKSA